MNLQLSKKDKRELRKLIDVGLIREFETGLKKSYKILEEWKNKEKETKDSYYDLFQHIKEFDKHIARRYDALKPSYYLLTVANLVKNKILSEDELIELSPETIAIIKKVLE